MFSVPAAFKQLVSFPSVHVAALPSSTTETTVHLRVESVERFSGNVTSGCDELDKTAVNDLVLIACHNEAEKKRLGEVLEAGQVASTQRLRLVLGQVRAGFRIVDGRAALAPW